MSTTLPPALVARGVMDHQVEQLRSQLRGAVFALVLLSACLWGTEPREGASRSAGEALDALAGTVAHLEGLGAWTLLVGATSLVTSERIVQIHGWSGAGPLDTRVLVSFAQQLALAEDAVRRTLEGETR